jgi:phosphate transport system substrate-binding protein
MEGSTTVGPIARAFAKHYEKRNPGVSVVVRETGSGRGARALIRGQCDVANMSRFLKPAEFQTAVQNGVRPVPQLIALDAIAVLVHPDNPVKRLTLNQVRRIYTGRIANWRQVGGRDRRIVLITRGAASGTFETFRTLVLKTEQMADDDARVVVTRNPREEIRKRPGGISYVGLGFVDDTVRALTIDGVPASPETVRAGRYPLVRCLFMVTDGPPEPGSPVHRLVTLHLTRQGQAMIESQGYVPVTAYEPGDE